MLQGKICSKFYKLKPKNIIAVTGTNGKTSVADLFYQLLTINNIPAASIGTLGIKYNNQIIKTNLTSPDAISIHENLAYLKKKKIENVIIEASSHGLDQKRLHDINFKGAIFTNFSQDHLDYHKNMNKYLNAKLVLFKDIIKLESSSKLFTISKTDITLTLEVYFKLLILILKSSVVISLLFSIFTLFIATVIISAPLASKAFLFIWKLIYLPVPIISLDSKILPPITNFLISFTNFF